MIGTTLDKYEVLQKVGEGGMATVYRGRHRTLRRDVAIKVLHPHLSSSTRNRKRFAREARAIEELRHDNILEIFDYSGTEAEDCYIITEFVEGQTLTEIIDHRAVLPSEITILLGIALCRALNYAHNKGILHRDLKPDNVMLRADAQVKLMDFGIARFLDESHVTMTGALVGSPAFMSPEQTSEFSLDARSDLFSLGTLLFFLVSGQLPFTGTNAHIILKKIAEGERPGVAELAPAMSPELADVIERLLQTRPDDRYPSAASAEEELQAALHASGLDPHDPRWALRAWLAAPDDYELALDAHLRQHLLAAGQDHLERGDHLTALRQFNRLLAIDEDNPEVLQLVQGLHQEQEPGRSRVAPLALSLLGLAFTAAIVVSLVDGEGRPRTEDASPLAGANVPRPVSPAVDAPAAVNPEEPPETEEAAPSVAAEEAREGPPRGAAREPGVRRQRPQALPSAVPAEAPPLGSIEVRSNYPADIFIDGERRGDTRQPAPIEVPAGTHEVVLRGEYLRDYRLLIEVEPGESWSSGEVLQLVPRPATVELDVAFDGACMVFVDKGLVGSIADAGRLVRIDHPEHPHEVAVECGEERTSEVFEDLMIMRKARLSP